MNSTKTKMQLNKIHDAIEDIKNGILKDHETEKENN